MWESPRLSFFVIEVFGTNAQPASARCRSNGVWAQPNKHFEFGFEKSDSKIASWYQLALLATTMRPFCPQLEIFRLEKNAMPTLEWIGKNKVVNHHQEVPFRVLERQYSFDEQGQHTENNDSENMIIHGDNLEALKALLPQYEGKVKCIYIVILTPILMSILSSENAVRLNFIIHIMFLALFEMRNYNVLCGGAKWTI